MCVQLAFERHFRHLAHNLPHYGYAYIVGAAHLLGSPFAVRIPTRSAVNRRRFHESALVYPASVNAKHTRWGGHLQVAGGDEGLDQLQRRRITRFRILQRQRPWRIDGSVGPTAFRRGWWLSALEKSGNAGLTVT